MLLWAALAMGLGIAGASRPACAQDAPVSGERTGTMKSTPFGILDDVVQTLRNGKPFGVLRLRTEFADAEGAKLSQAYTSRLAVGYESGNYRGFSFLAELEDVRAADESLYNAAGLNGEPRRTVIADPQATELNRLHANYELDALKTTFRIGRQRLILDDQRFVGNVGWRQNEQTFDAAYVGVKPNEALQVHYAYIWDIHRIFGDGSSAAVPNQLTDFHSDSHVFNVSYAANRAANVTAFIYALDVSGRNTTGPANSSTTYGVRMTGDTDATDSAKVGYEGSFAYQFQGDHNPTHYRARYIRGAGWASDPDLGKVSVGYEYLGSHHGRAQFRTPLATGHKFNGWADVFLDNAGTSGLAEFFLALAPKVPGEFSGEVSYHKFNTAQGGGDLGWEVDALVKRELVPNLDALVKGAYFEGPRDADIYRLCFQLALSY